MVVLILERVPPTLRGELSRWLIEPRTGVFVGMVSALVRDKLWDRVCERLEDKQEGAVLMLHTARTEQGFRVRSYGDPSRVPVDWEGLTLIRIPGLHPKDRKRVLGEHQQRLETLEPKPSRPKSAKPAAKRPPVMKLAVISAALLPNGEADPFADE